MISKNETSILKRIFEACVLDRSVLESLPPCTASGMIENVIKKTDSQAFDKAVSDFLNSNTGKDLSRDFFLIIIRSTHVMSKDLDDRDIAAKLENFNDLFKGCEVKPHRTIKTIYGADSNSLSEPIKIGSITIYTIPRHIDNIESLFGFSKHRFENSNTKVIAEHCSMVRDHIKALEVANKEFNTLDLLIAFLLGERNKTNAAGIMRLSFVPFQDPIITSTSGYFGGGVENFGFKKSVNVFDLLTPDPCKDAGVTSNLISFVLCPDDEMGRKISRGVEWLGEAYIEENKASAFIKVAVAMEALLKIDEKGIISSSIMSTIAEQCAFLLREDVNDCIEIEEKVKKMYGIRSKIVHSGSNSVEEYLLEEFLEFNRRVIFKITELKVKLNLKNMKELQDIIKGKKYSGFNN
ncbi:hypothetical protein PUZ01_002544 [Enterobacter cloacae]|nr:hypothetical protein [Enterobacter cloacae]EKV5785293.1 hypothetical protein [Enterobacter cloacae]